jgi:hypothetical protein
MSKLKVKEKKIVEEVVVPLAVKCHQNISTTRTSNPKDVLLLLSALKTEIWSTNTQAMTTNEEEKAVINEQAIMETSSLWMHLVDLIKFNHLTRLT